MKLRKNARKIFSACTLLSALAAPVVHATPVTNTVMAGGLEWAQATSFTSLSWAEVSTACPSGVCSGTLNGFTMDGWTWATSLDASALLHSFDPGFSATTTMNYMSSNSTSSLVQPLLDAFFGAGFLATASNSTVQIFRAYTADFVNDSSAKLLYAVDSLSGGFQTIGTAWFTGSGGDASTGSLFYRTPVAQPQNVPEPATLTLIGLGLLGTFSARKRKG